MKLKFMVAGVAAVAAFAINAQSNSSLSFIKVNGDATSVKSESLNITFSNGNLIADHADGQLVMPLAEIAKFRFTDGLSSLALPAEADKARVEVFTLTGRRVGAFESEAEARRTLASGIYAFKSGGKTFKVLVK